jgi:hypothetical protein
VLIMAVPARWLAILGSMTYVSWSGPAAAELTARALKKLSRAQRVTSPTFTAARALRLLDRGQLVFYGMGLWQDQHRLHLFQISDGTELVVEAPLASFFVKEATRFPAASGSGFPRYRLLDLLFYDRDHQRAGLLLEEVPPRTGLTRKSYYLHWDLSQRQITSFLPLGDESPLSFEALFYDPKGRELFCQSIERPRVRAEGVDGEVSMLALSDGKKRVVARFNAARSISSGPFVDPGRKRVLVAEYAEIADETPAPKGYLIELETGQQTTLPIPLTTYGVAFDSDASTVYLYSSKLGQLEARQLQTGKLLRSARVGALGHHLALVGKGQLLLLRNAGLQPIDLRRLTKRPLIPSARLYPGFSHVEGSFAVPTRAVIRNGHDLWLVELK